MKRAIFIYSLGIAFAITTLILYNSITQNTLRAAESKESEMEKVDAYKKLLEEFNKSNYMVDKGKAARELKQPKLSPAEEKEMKIINIALDGIKGKLSVPEGAKAIIRSEKNCYVVIFESKLPEGVLGGDFSAKVTIDAKSGKVSEILGSD